MIIQTPIQKIFENAKKKLTEEEIFEIQKEMINTYVEGYFEAGGGKKNLKRILLHSKLLKDIYNDKIVSWIKKNCAN